MKHSAHLTIGGLLSASLKALSASCLLLNSLALDIENHGLIRSSFKDEIDAWILRNFEPKDLIRNRIASMDLNILNILAEILVHIAFARLEVQTDGYSFYRRTTVNPNSTTGLALAIVVSRRKR